MKASFDYYRSNIDGLPVLKWQRKSLDDNIAISINSDVTELMWRDKCIHQSSTVSTMTIEFVKNKGTTMTDGRDVKWVIIAYPTLAPRRTHKKRRIAKKYMKQYGFVVHFIQGVAMNAIEFDDTIELTADSWIVADRHLPISSDTYRDAGGNICL